MQKLWDYVFDKLYCEKTGLIYDQITAYCQDGNICHLPTPEEIALQVPNPCSWGSGMEDSMIHGGIMLDAVINRYKLTGDEKMKVYANGLLKGIQLCSEVSGRRGFLARSVSPVDCKSYYINTSRDQYTHIIYSLLSLIETDLISDAQKEWCKDAIISYAERAEADATEQNGYQLFRADGKRGLVCRMWNVLPHEALRLPMFYLAAWVVSKDQHFLELYRKFRDEGISRSLEKQTAGNLYILLQTQYSIKLLYDYDPDPQYRDKYKAVLDFNCERAKQYRIQNVAKLDADYINSLAVQWRDCDLKYEWGNVVVEGYDYPIPQEPVRYHSDEFRQLGSALTIEALADTAADEEQMQNFRDAALLIDSEKHATATPVHLLSGYWSQKSLGL